MPRRWAIFDLDGTLSDCRHREHHAQAGQWEMFNKLCTLDPVHEAEAMILKSWHMAGGLVCYNTGRSKRYRPQTREWMTRHELPLGILLMREDGDYRSSLVVKKENLDKFIEEHIVGDSRITFIMEDQDKLVALWRELGFICLQPRLGSF